MNNIEIKLTKLSPKSGDIILFQSPTFLSKEQIEQLQEQILSLISSYDNVQGIILNGGMTVEKMTKEQIRSILLNKK